MQTEGCAPKGHQSFVPNKPAPDWALHLRLTRAEAGTMPSSSADINVCLVQTPLHTVPGGTGRGFHAPCGIPLSLKKS